MGWTRESEETWGWPKERHHGDLKKYKNILTGLLF